MAKLVICKDNEYESFKFVKKKKNNIVSTNRKDRAASRAIFEIDKNYKSIRKKNLGLFLKIDVSDGGGET